MPATPPPGMVKLSPAATARNLQGDITNGSYGKNWISFRNGNNVNEGDWQGSDDTYADPDVAKRLEDAASSSGATPAAPAATSTAATQATSPAASIVALGAPMGANGAGISAPGTVDTTSPRPNLGQRTPAQNSAALASLMRSIY